MAMSSPPPFENKPQCHKCGTKFNIITRQHHWYATLQHPRHATPLDSSLSRPDWSPLTIACVCVCVAVLLFAVATVAAPTATLAPRPTFRCPTIDCRSRSECAMSVSRTCKTTTGTSQWPQRSALQCTALPASRPLPALPAAAPPERLNSPLADVVLCMCVMLVCSERQRCLRHLPRVAGRPLLLQSALVLSCYTALWQADRRALPVLIVGFGWLVRAVLSLLCRSAL